MKMRRLISACWVTWPPHDLLTWLSLILAGAMPIVCAAAFLIVMSAAMPMSLPLMSGLLHAVAATADGGSAADRLVVGAMFQDPAEPADPWRQERLGVGEHRHDRVPEEEHDHEVQDGGEAEGEREAL